MISKILLNELDLTAEWCRGVGSYNTVHIAETTQITSLSMNISTIGFSEKDKYLRILLGSKLNCTFK